MLFIVRYAAMFASDHILSCSSAHLTNVSPSQPVLASLVLTTQLSEIRGKIGVATEVVGWG